MAEILILTSFIFAGIAIYLGLGPYLESMDDKIRGIVENMKDCNENERKVAYRSLRLIYSIMYLFVTSSFAEGGRAIQRRAGN